MILKAAYPLLIGAIAVGAVAWAVVSALQFEAKTDGPAVLHQRAGK